MKKKRKMMDQDYLTYISDFKHLLVIQSLLRLDDARQVDEFRRIRRATNMKDGAPGIWMIISAKRKLTKPGATYL